MAALTIVALGALGLLGACTFDRSGLGECRSDGDCAFGRCVDRVCIDVSDTGRDTQDPDLDDDPDADIDADAVGDAGCLPDTAICEDEVAVTCDSTGVESRLDCGAAATCSEDPFGCRCEVGACVPRLCEPDAEGCDDNDRILCNDDGSDFEVIETCGFAESCVGGDCVDDTCDPGVADCIGGVLIDCTPEGTIVITRDCALDDLSCDAELGECRCGDEPACEDDEVCIDPTNGSCLCDGTECDPGETCDGVNGCRCGDGGPDCATGSSCLDDTCVCEPGRFGSDCGGVCDCQNGGSCDDGAQGDGSCTCLSGFFEANCSGVCDCQNGASCADGVDGDGACTCVSGFYGSDCAGVCGCQNGGSCADGVDGDGACTCESGFYGSDCAGVCDCQNGGSCADGAGGDGACTCQAGFYGSDCTGVCDCQNGGSCADGAGGDGACTCQAGFYGSDCAGVCEDCGLGTCNDGAGGDGTCECPVGAYGSDCSGICDCQNGASCNDGVDGDGACTCAAGFYGTDCSGVCDCQNGGSCAEGAGGDGACTCAAGFYGTDCSGVCDCQNGGSCAEGAGGDGACTCAAGFYGSDCTGVCDCQNGGGCNEGADGDGACTCLSGFYGEDCAGICPDCSPGLCRDGASGDGSCTSPQFNVQRGTVVLTGTTIQITTADADYVAPTGPALIRLVNTRLTGMGRISGGGKKQPNRWMVWIADVASDWSTVTFEREVDNDDCRVMWEIVEYTGDPGGPNAMVVHQQGVAAYASGDLGASSSPALTGETSVSDDGDVVVFITGQATSAGGDREANRGLSTASWDGTAGVADFTRGETGDTASVSYAIVELTGSNWSVERVPFGHTTADAVETASIADVGDVTRAFLHAQYQSDDGIDEVDELGAEVWLSASDELSFQLESGADIGMDSVVWVISNGDATSSGLQAQHYSGTRTDGGSEEDCWDESITAVPDMDLASIWGETARTSAEQARDVPRGSISLRMTAVDTVELCQSDADQTRAYRYSVVYWPWN